MNRAVVRDFLVGLTAILGVAGLVFMLMLFGELRKGLERVYPVKISMPDASGISGTSPVLFNGVRVGTITKLEVADPPPEGMIATLSVDRGVKIPRDLAVSVETRFIGDSALALGFADNADRSQYIGESEYAAGGSAKPIRVVPRTLFGDLKKP
ncbi:MAG: MlaD family protein, partial [Phycisphaerae bacterium]